MERMSTLLKLICYLPSEISARQEVGVLVVTPPTVEMSPEVPIISSLFVMNDIPIFV